jgi:hypothetical protein
MKASSRTELAGRAGQRETSCSGIEMRFAGNAASGFEKINL